MNFTFQIFIQKNVDSSVFIHRFFYIFLSFYILSFPPDQFYPLKFSYYLITSNHQYTSLIVSNLVLKLLLIDYQSLQLP